MCPFSDLSLQYVSKFPFLLVSTLIFNNFFFTSTTFSATFSALGQRTMAHPVSNGNSDITKAPKLNVCVVVIFVSMLRLCLCSESMECYIERESEAR